MINKKVSTSLAIVVVIVVFVLANGFLFFQSREKKEIVKMKDSENKSVVLSVDSIKKTKNKKEKNIDLKDTLRVEDFVLLKNIGTTTVSGSGEQVNIYKSDELGIQFYSGPGNMILVKNKNNEFEGFKEIADIGRCSHASDCEVFNSRVYQRYNGGSIKIFNKPASKELSVAVSDIIKENKKDPENCEIKINNYTNVGIYKGQLTARIVLLESYIPTENEKLLYLKERYYSNLDLKKINQLCEEGPECIWAEQDLLGAKTTTACSSYSACFGYQCDSFFLYEPKVTMEKFLYVRSQAATPSFYTWSSLKIIN